MKRNHFINLFVCCVVLLVSCMNVWAQTPDPYLSQPLTFVANETTTIYLAKTSGNPTVTTIGALHLQYSTNGQDWAPFTPAKTTPITIEAGNTMMLRRNPEQGINTSGFGYNGNNVYDYRWYFVTTGNYSLEGNIMSLVDGTDFATNTTIPATYECFNSLFINNTALTNIDNLRLPATTLKNRCYRSLFEGCTGLKDISQFQLTEPVSVDTYEYLRMFYGCSGLVSINGFRIPALLGTYACENMFYGCTGLTNIENLVFAADILPKLCYNNMFSGCTNLATPMDTFKVSVIGETSCKQMFTGCTSLTKTPVIVVDSIGKSGCYLMFQNCGTNLTGTDSLQAGDIIVSRAIGTTGCQQMYDGCSRLKRIPNITAKRIIGGSDKTGGCYYMFYKTSARAGGIFKADLVETRGCQGMFYQSTTLAKFDSIVVDSVGTYGLTSLFSGCTALIRMPKIKIRALGGTYTMQYMFNGCKSLTFNNDTLFNKKLTNYCYFHMFEGCTGITSASNLHLAADTLASYAYHLMFTGCTGMKSVKDTFRVSVIGDHSCYQMFNGCTGLAATPVLWVDSIGSSGCNLMFQKCGTALTETDSLIAGNIHVKGTIYHNGCTDLFTGCTRLRKAPALYAGRIAGTSNSNGGCYYMYNTLTGLVEGNFIKVGTIDTYGCYKMYYSDNAMVKMDSIIVDSIGSYGCQQMFEASNNNFVHAPRIKARVVGPKGCYDMYDSKHITESDTIEAQIVHKQGFSTMFNKSYIQTLPYIKVDSIGELGCEKMFTGCTSLQIGKDTLPTLKLGPSAYSYLFTGCTGITDISQLHLPANKMADNCYQYMFNGCTGISGNMKLKLPADNMAFHCYTYMFNGCKNITSVTGFSLPAMHTADSCYTHLFEGCTSLQDISGMTYANTDLAPGAYRYMFGNCSALETPMDTFRVKSIGEYACYRTFNNCGKLTKTPVIVTDSIGYYGCSHMFEACNTNTGVDSMVVSDIHVKGTIYNDGCRNMFSACSRIKRGANLYVGRIAGADKNGGCLDMYYQLKGLVEGGTLHTGTIDNYGAVSMYNACTKLSKMDTIIVDSIGDYGCYTMFLGNTAMKRTPYIKARVIGSNGLKSMCSGSTAVQYADTIRAEKIYNNGLESAFASCNLSDGMPLLVADSIGYQGCLNMFSTTKITRLPKLQVRAVGENAFEKMFQTCAQLSFQDGDIIPAATNTRSHQNMFNNCSGITDLSPLCMLAQDLKPYCYNNMFNTCANLTTPMNSLNVKVIGDHSCYQMFNACKKLDTAPSIIADSIGPNGCQQMFLNCFTSTTVGLSSAGDIVVNGKVASLGLNEMYKGCGRLATAPNVTVGSIESNGTAKTGGCYQMFYQLGGLTKAGYLRADTIQSFGCYLMFQECAKLVSMDSIMVDSIGTQGCWQMFYNDGKFAHTPKLDANIIGQQGCYKMWNCTTAITSADTIRAHKVYEGGLQESFNGCTKLDASPYIKIDSVGQKGCLNMFKGCYATTPTGILTADSIIIGKMGPYACQSMFEGCKRLTTIKGIKNTNTYDYACNNMFKTCTGLVDISNVTLPAPIMGAHCYDNMFNGCTAMTTIMPSINASYIGEQSCFQMFNGCTKLAAAPAICVDSIGLKGCQQMFLNCSTSTTGLSSAGDIVVNGKVASLGLNEMYKGCGRLATAPNVTVGSIESNGTAKTGGCYQMFYQLGGLTKAGYLRADTIQSFGCYLMFQECAKLESMDSIMVDSIGTQGCWQMFYNDGKFAHTPKLDANIIGQQGCYQMWNCTTAIASADTIRAHKIYDEGCREMFSGCKKLAASPYIKIDKVGKNGCLNMFLNCYTDANNGILTADSIIFGSVGESGCQTMFSGCKRLQVSPKITADSVGYRGFYQMFTTCYASATVGLRKTDTIRVTRAIGRQGLEEMFTGCQRLDTACAILTPKVGEAGCKNLFKDCFKVATTATKRYSEGFGSTAILLGDSACHQMFNTCLLLDSCADLQFSTIGTRACDKMFYLCNGLDVAPAVSAQKVKDYGCFQMFNYANTSATTKPAGFDHARAITLGEVGNYGCYQMFFQCRNLAAAPNLTFNKVGNHGCYQMFQNAYSVASSVYYGIASTNTFSIREIGSYGCAEMFSGCQRLEESPAITAVSVGAHGCEKMFYNCFVNATIGLKNVGNIIANTVASNGYANMFDGCKRLDSIQNHRIYADYMGDHACLKMFVNCTALTQAPRMDVDEMGPYACQYMYNGCTGLTKMPQLPTMKIGDYCYSHMFDGCTKLTDTTSLPVTAITDGCYEYMFQNCSALTVSPAMAAITVKPYCYQGMFKGCAKLTEVPVLPATKLATYCYQNMFQGCTSLVNAPALPATELVTGCYTQMFNGCSALKYIKVNFTDWQYFGAATDPTYKWVTDVGAVGEFICPEALPKQYDENHIPSKFVVTSAAGYRLIFDANGGSWPDGTTEQVSIAQSAIDDIPHATKKGCMFTRWNTKADGTGEDINLGNLPDEDMTYYAQYDSIGVQLHKWQNNAIFLSITNLPAEAEEAVIQVVGGGSAKSATLDLSLVDVGVYQLGFNKKDVSLHQGGILDVTIYDEDENVLGVVSLPIPFLISDAVNSSDLDATDNADIWVLNGGTLTFDDNRNCRTLCITAGGKAVVPAMSVLTIDSIVLRGGELVNGSYLYDYPQLLVNGSVLNHSGQVNYQYLCGLQQNYTLSLPSSVNVADVKNIDGTDAILGVYRYNGETRAKGQSGWEEIWDPTREDMTPPMLKAGQGYTIYGVPTEIINDRRRNYCYLNFPMTIDLSEGELPEGDGKIVSVTHYGMTDGHLDAGIAPNNAGWNLIGNPYLSNFAGTDETGFENGVIGQLVKDADGNYHWDGDARYVVIPSDNGQSYTAEMVSESTLPAFKNFFIQVSTGDALNFAKAGRQQSAPQRAMQADNEVMLGVRLTGNGVDDRMGILLGDDFSDDYELNADLDKWPNNGLNLSATVGKYNLCIAAISHERVTRPVEMKVITTANDTYRFSLAEEWMKNNGALAHLYLYDREKQTYTDLLETDYEVSLGAKTHSGRFYLSAEERTTPTQIYEMGENMLYVTATNGHISVSGIDAPAHVSVYTMSGICIFNEEVSDVADIHAQCGVYVLRVEIGDEVHARTIVVP